MVEPLLHYKHCYKLFLPDTGYWLYNICDQMKECFSFVPPLCGIVLSTVTLTVKCLFLFVFLFFFHPVIELSFQANLAHIFGFIYFYLCNFGVLTV